MTVANGALPFVHDESNTDPSFHRAPSYCITTVWPALTGAPLPWMTVFATRSVGAGLAEGIVIFGSFGFFGSCAKYGCTCGSEASRARFGPVGTSAVAT